MHLLWSYLNNFRPTVCVRDKWLTLKLSVSSVWICCIIFITVHFFSATSLLCFILQQQKINLVCCSMSTDELISTVVFWNVTPCCLLVSYNILEEFIAFILCSSVLKMEMTCFFKMLVTIYKIAWTRNQYSTIDIFTAMGSSISDVTVLYFSMTEEEV
jgi:hypothetical protein